MFKLLKVLVFLGFLAVLGFFLLAITGGGDKIRQASRKFTKESARIAESADSLKKSADGIKSKARDSIDKTQGILNTISKE